LGQNGIVFIKPRKSPNLTYCDFNQPAKGKLGVADYLDVKSMIIHKEELIALLK
jgi:hypothetical protein